MSTNDHTKDIHEVKDTQQLSIMPQLQLEMCISYATHNSTILFYKQCQ